MTDMIAELKSIVPPPPRDAEAAQAQNWDMVEMALGTKLPDDFKTFQNIWGEGDIAQFVHLFMPGTAKKPIRYPEAAQAFVNAYATMKTGHPERFPLPLLPAPGSFLPFAITDNGDYLGWILDEGDPNAWHVAVLPDEDGIPEVFAMSFSEFLHGLISGTVKPRHLPGDLASEPILFRPR